MRFLSCRRTLGHRRSRWVLSVRRGRAGRALSRGRTRLECRLARACLSADEIYRLARAQNLSRSRCTAWASLQQTSTATAALTKYARSALQPGPGTFLWAHCPRRICRLHCACASAAPLSLLTLLLVCCVRSDDAETNESIGLDTRFCDLRQHRDRGHRPRRDQPRLLATTRHLPRVLSDCDSALATFVRTCLSRCCLHVCGHLLRACLVRVVCRRRACSACCVAGGPRDFAFDRAVISRCLALVFYALNAVEFKKRTTPQPEGSSLGSSGELRCLVVLRVVLRVVVLLWSC